LRLIGAALGIAFLAMCARFFSRLIAATKSIAAVDRWHDLAGYSICCSCFVGSLLLARWLAKRVSVIL